MNIFKRAEDIFLKIERVTTQRKKWLKFHVSVINFFHTTNDRHWKGNLTTAVVVQKWLLRHLKFIGILGAYIIEANWLCLIWKIKLDIFSTGDSICSWCLNITRHIVFIDCFLLPIVKSSVKSLRGSKRDIFFYNFPFVNLYLVISKENSLHFY